MRMSLIAWFTLSALGTAAPATAQNVSLDRVEELATSGRSEDARVLLMRWWEGTRPGASRRDVQRGLWLRGRLTVDPVQADLDYRRLAIEYPGGPYSDAALLRLAQSAQARGELEASAGHLRRLRTEYPSSSVLSEADRWLSLVGPLPAPPEPAAATPQTASPSPAPPTARTEAPRPRAGFAVQLGAFSEAERARNVLDALVEAGFEGRLVQVEGSPLVRVRTGAFVTRDEAAALADRLSQRGFQVAVVLDADKERPVGR